MVFFFVPSFMSFKRGVRGNGYAVQRHRQPDLWFWWRRGQLCRSKESPCKLCKLMQFHIFMPGIRTRNLHFKQESENMKYEKFNFFVKGQLCPWLSTLQSWWRPSEVFSGLWNSALKVLQRSIISNEGLAEIKKDNGIGRHWLWENTYLFIDLLAP